MILIFKMGGMTVPEYIKNELKSFGIKDAEALPLSMCRVVRPYKLERCGFYDLESLSVLIFAIPYYTAHKEKNISSYAIPRDYHLFCRELFDTIIPRLTEKYPENKFVGFADNSPIDERDAAAIAGLGIIGKNGMLITEKYSSYVFLAEIITDLPLKHSEKHEIAYCKDCGICASACPKGELGECLSAITQKKGELTEAEKEAIKKYGCAWGCDICSEVCPHTKKAIENNTIYTDIPFFLSNLTPTLTSGAVMDMSDEEFSSRAYSWRKKETILRNLSIIEDKT
jgi:epoxyqueuosine reductase QueG